MTSLARLSPKDKRKAQDFSCAAILSLLSPDDLSGNHPLHRKKHTLRDEWMKHEGKKLLTIVAQRAIIYLP